MDHTSSFEFTESNFTKRPNAKGKPRATNVYLVEVFNTISISCFRCLHDVSFQTKDV